MKNKQDHERYCLTKTQEESNRAATICAEGNRTTGLKFLESLQRNLIDTLPPITFTNTL